MNVKYNIGYNSSDGISFEIYVYGCKREPKCVNCHNPELWEFGETNYLDYNELDEVIKKYKGKFDNFVIMGGEPLDQNTFELVTLLKTLKNNYKLPIWLYTSYDYQDIPDFILVHLNYLKTGTYQEELKTDNNIQFGVKLASENQNMIKILKNGVE